MKSTGIIRGIDELGRFSILKEIRKNLDIQRGDKLEVFTDGDTICLQKYDENKSLSEMVDMFEAYVETQCEDSAEKGEALNLIQGVRKVMKGADTP